MEIISFTGKSGTGKSYQAVRLCNIFGCDAIIDDGLLIYKNSIVAGTSAKSCPTKAEAMRTTLFYHDSHRREIINALKKYAPERLLVLGTSDRMVDMIVETLELPPVSKREYIYDYVSEKELKTAMVSRCEHGEHTIPAPVGEIKRSFAGYFMNPAKIFKGKTSDDKEIIFERTVVKPKYSYNGAFRISENAIWDIINIVADDYKGIIKPLKYTNNENPSSLKIKIDVEIFNIKKGIKRCPLLQRDVKKAIEASTGFVVHSVDVNISSVVRKKTRAEKRSGLRRARSELNQPLGNQEKQTRRVSGKVTKVNKVKQNKKR